LTCSRDRAPGAVVVRPDGKVRTSWIMLEGGMKVIVGGQPVPDADED
jgi:hypothetical protein